MYNVSYPIFFWTEHGPYRLFQKIDMFMIMILADLYPVGMTGSRTKIEDNEIKNKRNEIKAPHP